ncbi:hypothetical protein FKQ62_12865 [Vibrio sp. B1-2]|uniref:hypothetical protein n=1 Tax=Vibrio sp. B1-2 TaxID=2591465 RepID=UPI0014838D48|nr:hypothetical protein [Vibrio sp. B1-2]NNO00327.1 hypothetical protein [Vibrio sp. B1-2]
MFVRERNMQDWLSEHINRNYGFRDLVEELEYTPKTLEDRVIWDSYNYCLEFLYQVESISEDENISKYMSEILKPDFFLFCPGYESFVIVELKNDRNATRQTGTELSAYVNAIKNHFPLISDSDVCSVIISSHWPTLLKNNVFNEMFWHRRKILCLEPVQYSNGDIKLARVPPRLLYDQAITNTFKDSDFSGMHFPIESRVRNVKEIALDNHLGQIKSAFRRMCRKAEKNGSHGFAFLWRFHEDLKRSADYCITFVDINPFKINISSSVSNSVRYEMIYKLNHFLRQAEVNGVTRNTIASMWSGQDMLRGVASAGPENSGSWQRLQEEMAWEGNVISFIPWGIIADLYEEFLPGAYASGEDFSYDNPTTGFDFLELVIPNNAL